VFAGTLVQRIRTIGGGVNVNSRKALVASIAIVCLTLLMVLEKMDPSIGSTGIVGITMYIIGNGVAAGTGKDVDPIVKRKRSKLERFDDEEN
jgi:membrane-bound ClpP family serine protease